MTTLEQQRRKALLAWYGRHGRTLPWRALAGQRSDPYRVWLSEIMLQQTTVATVKPYFQAFVERWPTLNDLAKADLDDILHGWQGLGYYARARNLHKCAQVVAMEYGGRLPDLEAELLTLPGIGPYTAAAIAAIAFGRPSAPVDGNIERVISRLLALNKPIPELRKDVVPALLALTSKRRPGDFVQALMDLGATICSPKAAKCDDCPWADLKAGGCAARIAGNATGYPVRKPNKKKPLRRGVVFWAENDQAQIFLRRRPDRGLLGGMMEFPSTDWRQHRWGLNEALKQAPFAADWRQIQGVVRHTFTHFHLELALCMGRVEAMVGEGGVWCSPENFSDHALPSLMKKIAGACEKGKI